MLTGISVLALISAVLTIHGKYSEDKRFIYVFKPAATILIICVAIKGNNSYLNSEYYIYIALLFCLLGDILLMVPGKFLQGLAAFLIAHLFFITGFFVITYSLHLWLIILFSVLPGIVYWSLYHNLGKYRTPALFYVIAVSVMTWRGWEVFFNDYTSGSLLLATGGLLFMISDIFNAVNRFIKPFRSAECVILGCYYSGIWMIAIAM